MRGNSVDILRLGMEAIKILLVVNKKKDEYFYGCNQYPKCKHTESDTIDQFDV